MSMFDRGQTVRQKKSPDKFASKCLSFQLSSWPELMEAGDVPAPPAWDSRWRAKGGVQAILTSFNIKVKVHQCIDADYK